MIKQNIIVFCIGISIVSTMAQGTVIEPSRQTSAETELLLQELRTQRTNNETLLNTIRNDISSLQKKVNPLSLKRMGKFTIVGLAGYGAYNLYHDYVNSEYKPMVDEKLQQAQAFFNAISTNNQVEEKTNDQ